MAKQYQYKPGQFVWIYGKKHRVTKAPSTPTYFCCPYRKKFSCILPVWSHTGCAILLPYDCYPKPI